MSLRSDAKWFYHRCENSSCTVALPLCEGKLKLIDCKGNYGDLVDKFGLEKHADELSEPQRSLRHVASYQNFKDGTGRPEWANGAFVFLSVAWASEAKQAVADKGLTLRKGHILFSEELTPIVMDLLNTRVENSNISTREQYRRSRHERRIEQEIPCPVFSSIDHLQAKHQRSVHEIGMDPVALPWKCASIPHCSYSSRLTHTTGSAPRDAEARRYDYGPMRKRFHLKNDLFQKFTDDATNGRVDDAWDAFLALKETFPKARLTILYNLMLEACATAGSTDLAQQCFLEMKQHEVMLNTQSFEKMIRCHLQVHDGKEAEHWFQQQLMHGFVGEKKSLRAIVDVFSTPNEATEGAARARIWTTISESIDVNSDTIDLDAIINALANAGELDEAELWLGRAEDGGLVLNVITYTSVIDACIKAGKVKSAERWLEQVDTRGLLHDDGAYISAINACAKAGDVRSAQQWLGQTEAKDMVAIVISYNSVIIACAKEGDVRSAQRWLKNLEAKGVLAEVTTYASVIDACFKIGDVRSAQWWLERTEAQSMNVNVITNTSRIDA
eukprot:TRINITY_DN64443_c0_g1_i1.p1 TRINITY_DN64443_c0_g1~~TRINITY_DN64443_c0_g1_i1.p1  ORF type:complete len:557 (-),score=83.12 TRINITY_DN64443_c0_g1_i1:470-2140(-)